MKVLAGDFQTRTGSGAQANFIYSHPIGQFTFPDPNKELWFWPRHVTYYMDSVEEIQEITDENKVKVLGAAGWGALGGLALGPLGLIAGMVLGGRGKVVVCAVKFKDGKQALLEVNQKEWTNIVAARFQLETMHRQGKNVYEKLSESGKSNSGINGVDHHADCSRRRSLRFLLDHFSMKWIAIFLLPWSLSAQSGVLRGPTRVIDGDTLRIGSERVRMVGIDAPEAKQSCKRSNVEQWACGEASSLALIRKIAGRSIKCKYAERDRYGRILGTCYASGEDLSAWMVRNGWALAYRRYSKEYVKQEAQAQADGLGVWSGEFTKPWEWRKESL